MLLKSHAIICTVQQIATVSELKGDKHSCLQKIPFFKFVAQNWYVLVMVFALLFGMLVSIWRKNENALLCTQFT